MVIFDCESEKMMDCWGECSTAGAFYKQNFPAIGLKSLIFTGF